MQNNAAVGGKGDGTKPGTSSSKVEPIVIVNGHYREWFNAIAPRKSPEIEKLENISDEVESLRVIENEVKTLENESFRQTNWPQKQVTLGLIKQTITNLEKNIAEKILLANAMIHQRAMSATIIRRIEKVQNLRLSWMHHLYLLQNQLFYLENILNVDSSKCEEPIPLAVIKFEDTPFPSVFTELSKLSEEVSIILKLSPFDSVEMQQKSDPSLFVIYNDIEVPATGLLGYTIEKESVNSNEIRYRFKNLVVSEQFPREILVFLRVRVEMEQKTKSDVHNLNIESVMTKPFVVIDDHSRWGNAIEVLFKHIVFYQEELGGHYYIPMKLRKTTVPIFRLANCLEYLLYRCLKINLKHSNRVPSRGISHLERITLSYLLAQTGKKDLEFKEEEVVRVLAHIQKEFVDLLADKTIGKLWLTGYIIGFVGQVQAESLLNTYGKDNNGVFMLVVEKKLYLYYLAMDKAVKKQEISLTQLQAMLSLKSILTLNGAGGDETYTLTPKQELFAQLT